LILTSGLTQDPRWHAERLPFQPVDAVLKAYHWALKEKARRTNEMSTTVARLAEMVEIAAFPGLGNKARGQDAFLPFKIIDAPGKNARITEETAGVIRWLISNGQMPQRVLVLALAELERSGF
jgi:hypothetical protein